MNHVEGRTVHTATETHDSGLRLVIDGDVVVVRHTVVHENLLWLWLVSKLLMNGRVMSPSIYFVA